MTYLDVLLYRVTTWILMRRIQWNLTEAGLLISYADWRRKKRDSMISDLQAQFDMMDGRLRDNGH